MSPNEAVPRPKIIAGFLAGIATSALLAVVGLGGLVGWFGNRVIPGSQAK